jgi:hypothetical protein
MSPMLQSGSHLPNGSKEEEKNVNLDQARDMLSLDFSTKISNAFLISPVCAT